MAEITGLNGAPISLGKKVTLTLAMDMPSGKLDIGGEIYNYDVALNMLAQAARWFQVRYDAAQMVGIQAEQAQAERLARMIQQ